jgi:hypothetical protein
MSTCLPNDLMTLNPLEMTPSDTYRVYGHIVTSQQSPDGIPFKFTIDESVRGALIQGSNGYILAQSSIRSPLPLPAADGPNEQQGDSDGKVTSKKRKDHGNNQDEESDVHTAKKTKARHVLDTLYIALAKLLLLVTFTRNLQQNEKRKKLAPVVIQLQLLSLDNEFHARSGRVRVREVVSRLVYMKEYRNMSRARLVSISGYYNHRLRENT